MVAFNRSTFRPRRQRRSTTRSAIAKKTNASGNQAVKRVYQRKNTAPKTKADANKSAIATLARQVKTLQLKEFGNYQQNIEHFSLTGGAIAWNVKQPVCFAINNFLHEAPVFIGHDDADLHLPAHATIGNFQVTAPASSYPEYSYWAGAQDDTANPESYKPISTTLLINFEAPALQPNIEYWCRMDIIKPKKILMNTNAHKLGLPQNIQALSNLAHNDMVSRNRYNPEYFNVLMTRWIKLSNNNDVNKTIEKFMKVYFKFPDKPNTTTKLGAGETKTTFSGDLVTSFFTNMPEDEVYWCVLSTSNTGNNDDTNHVKMQIQRRIAYRDKFGYST